MIWLAIVLGLITVVSALGYIFITDEDSRNGAAVIGILNGLFSVVIGVTSCITIIKAGNVGVEVLFGDVQAHVLESGLHFVNPFTSIEQMSVRTENYWMSASHEEGQKKGDDSVSIRSANGLQMPVDVAVPYRLVSDTAPWVYKNLGMDYVEKLVRPAVQTAARRAASHYTAEEIYSIKRDEFAEKTRTYTEEELRKLLTDSYQGKNPPEQVLVVSQILVGHIGIPDNVRLAIENKLKADQEQQAMDFRILKEKKEAERKVVEAKGIKDFQDIVSQGINEHTLRWKALDATMHLAESNNSKIIIIGAGKDGLPVLLGSQELQRQ